MILFNNRMKLQLVSLHSFNTDLDTCFNVAILKRLTTNYKLIDYIVVRNLNINELDNSCDWANAIQYDIDNLTEATNIFINLII